ncbi:MAG: hypothetical protein QW128_07155 [Thermoprotei archaeon]
MNIRRPLYKLMPIVSLIVVYIIVYYLLISNVLFTKTGDIVWLSAMNDLWGSYYRYNSFAIVTFALNSLTLSPMLSMNTIILLFFITLFIPGYLFITRIAKNAFLGFLAGILFLAYPINIQLIEESKYDIFSSIVVLGITMYVFYSICDRHDVRALLILFTSSLVVSLFSPYSGMVYFLSIFVYYVRDLIKGNTKFLGNVLSVSPSLLLYFLLHREPIGSEFISLELLPLFFLVSSGIIGMLYMHAHLINGKGNIVLLSWFIGIILASLLSFDAGVFLIYGQYPLVIYAIFLLGFGARNLYSIVKREGEELTVEIDVLKLGAILLTTLLFISSVVASINVYGTSINSSRLFLDIYGNNDLIEALNWISKNTDRNAVIVSEYPLGSWINLYTGRPTLENKPSSLNISMKDFLSSYDADSILNSNFEIRNRYIRVRDWSPVAPQRDPVIGSSDGYNYVDFLYIDENHAKVKYVLDGKTVEPDFYNYKSTHSEWIYRNDSSAMLHHVYLLDGVRIDKYLTVSRSSEVKIVYNVTGGSDVRILGFSLKLWIPWERKLGFTQVKNNTFSVSMDSGDYQVIVSSRLMNMSFGPDEKWTQYRLLCNYEPIGNNIYTEIIVKALNAKSVSWMDDKIVAISADELMAKYRVAYLVVPTIIKKEFMDRFGLDYSRFKSQFENEKITIYKVTL